MNKPTLVVDDLESKRRYLADCARRMRPENKVIEAACVREARQKIKQLGRDGIQGGVIDFDLPDGDGGEVIEELRRENPLACVALATARDHECFEDEAKPIALHAGANDALSTCQEGFEQRLHDVLTLAA